MSLNKIYQHQRVPFLRLVLVVTRVRSSTLAISISGPKSNFVTRHNFTFTSSNIIYCISCIKCWKLYIGETGRRLSDRFAEHLRSVRNNDLDKPVARHFNATNHSISNIKFVPIHPFLVVMIAVKDAKSVSFLKLKPFIPTALTNDFLLLDHIPSEFLFLSSKGGQKR